MELLIPGLILVALMVWASTRIKKTAALAFEPETIETEDFVIYKPEGFLNVVNGDPELKFEAYSREFGGMGAEDIKQARVEIRRFEGSDVRDASERIGKLAKIVTDVSEIIGERKYRVIEAERVEKGISFREYYKIARVDSGDLELKIIALKEPNGETSRKIEAILASFTAK